MVRGLEGQQVPRRDGGVYRLQWWRVSATVVAYVGYSASSALRFECVVPRGLIASELRIPCGLIAAWVYRASP